MLRFVLTRLLMLVPTFLGVTAAAFAFIRLIPGDPIELLVGERGIDPARHAMLLHEMGFDRPLWEQYLGFLGEVLHGNLGKSIVTPIARGSTSSDMGSRLKTSNAIAVESANRGVVARFSWTTPTPVSHLRSSSRSSRWR